jgi:hypothetical protein
VLVTSLIFHDEAKLCSISVIKKATISNDLNNKSVLAQVPGCAKQ